MNVTEGLRKHAFWLYGVIVGLAIKDALEIVVRHQITTPAGMQRDALPESARLIIFLSTIIQFYLGSVVYFDKAYENPQTSTKYGNKNYAVDFLFGLIHFLFFFCWAISIDTHSGHLRLFPILLALILLYDIVWLLACLNYDTYNIMKLWTFVNAGVVIVAVAVYFVILYIWTDHRFAEEIAFIPILFVSLLDIIGMITGKEIIATWFSNLVN